MSSVKLIAVLCSALFLLIVSMSVHSSELFFMCIALVSLPMISYVFGRFAAKGLQCSREAPSCISEEETFHVRIRLHGRSNLLGAIKIENPLPEWIVMNQEKSLSRRVSSKQTLISYDAMALKRGVYELGHIRLHSSDPLGFFQFNSKYAISSPLVVLPKPLEIRDMRIRPLGGLGEYQFEGVGAKGSGTDFHGVREYQSGDELRRIHWHSMAKYGHLNVIEFEHSKAEDAVIAIDLKQGSEIGAGRYSSLEYAIRIAASVSEEMLRLGAAVRLACSGLDGLATTPNRGLSHQHVILDALARIEANRKESLSEVLLGKLDSIRRGSVVMCFSSGIDEDFPQCAELLIARGAKAQMFLINLETELSQRDREMAWALKAIGSNFTVINCSQDSIAGYLRYDDAA